MHPSLATAMEGKAPGDLHPVRILLASSETWLEACEVPLSHFSVSP